MKAMITDGGEHKPLLINGKHTKPYIAYNTRFLKVLACDQQSRR
jgi:hypothetical protein